MGRIGDFPFYSAIAAYQEFFQDEATILLRNTHLGWNELPMYCEKNLMGGGEYVDIFHSFLLWIQGEKR